MARYKTVCKRSVASWTVQHGDRIPFPHPTADHMAHDISQCNKHPVIHEEAADGAVWLQGFLMEARKRKAHLTWGPAGTSVCPFQVGRHVVEAQ
jgi:hypothetical protein